jgi:DNA-directed RNA polymerase subunit E'
MGKIGITCRQPFLGALDWIAEEIKKAKQPAAQPATAKKGGK